MQILRLQPLGVELGAQQLIFGYQMIAGVGCPRRAVITFPL
jgi:hypothetical protein